MRKLAVLAAVVMVIMAIAAPVSARSENAPDKTWVCHVTHSDQKNPVVLVNVANGWFNGHGDKVNGTKDSAKHQDYDSEYFGADENTKAGPIDVRIEDGECGLGEPEPPS